MKKDRVAIERRSLLNTLKDLQRTVDALTRDVSEGYIPEDFHVTGAIVNTSLRAHAASIRLIAYQEAGLTLLETPPSCDGEPR